MSGGDDPPRSEALTTRAIAVVAGSTLAVTFAAVVILLVVLGSGTPQDAVRVSIVQTAAGIGLGAGGALALLLAARRQRTAELTLELQRDTDAAGIRDADARRVTELYAGAAEQLGSDSSVTRLAGVYALERLATDAAQLRQAVVDILCAYLRMPFDAASVVAGTAGEHLLRERTVRSGVQRVLRLHLRGHGHPDTFWAGMTVDLSRAELIDATFIGCTMGRAEFSRAEFHGPAQFGGLQVDGDAFFGSAVFHGDAWFSGATFHGQAFFDGIQVGGTTHFRAAGDAPGALPAAKAGPLLHVGSTDATFDQGIWLAGSTFAGPLHLDPAEVRDST